jgi:protein involved in polysaccharide export with SLBB domain
MRVSARYVASVCCAILIVGVLNAQSKTDQTIPDFLSTRPDVKAAAKTQLESRTVAMDAPLDASAYYLGPADLLSLNLSSVSPMEYLLTVTPEEYLLIPTVGAVNVRGLTLEEARKTVIPLTRKKYPGTDATLTLVSPRKLSVEIAGQVMNEGMHEANSVERVDRLIELANTLPATQITKNFYDFQLPGLRRAASERYIAVVHHDGTTQRVDLVKYHMTGNSLYNPYLREGDRVYVPFRRPGDNNVGVFGAVVGPTSVEYAEGDSVADLIKLGFGLKPDAEPRRACLARQSEDGRLMDTMWLDLAAIMEKRAPNIALRPGDRLVVSSIPELRHGDYVRVEGEVAQPGRYPITPFSTKVSEVIRMAGGFTPTANIGGATILRGRPFAIDPGVEMADEQLRSRRTTVVGQDSLYYQTETLLRLQGEYVSIDFRRIFLQGDTAADLTVRPFDRISIPVKTRSVYVFGQVVLPGHVPLKEGEDYRYYIEKANGFTTEARKGDVKVIKAGTRVWLDPSETTIEDGDYLWIPREPTYPFSYYMTVYSQIAGILGAVATVALLIYTVK